MSEQAPAQEQSAPTPTPTGRERFSGLPANEIADQLATAMMNNQGKETIDALQAALAASTDAKAPEPESVSAVVPKEQTEPTPTPEPEAPVVEKSPEEIAAEAAAAEAAAEQQEEKESANHIRIKTYPDKEKDLVSMAHQMFKKGLAPSFTEALDRLRGITPTVQSEPDPEPAAIPPEITALETEIATLEASMDEAGNGEGLLNKDFTDLTKRLSKANAKLEAARARYESAAETQAVVSDAAFEQQREVILKQTLKEFPDAGDKNGPLWMLAESLAKKAADPSHVHHDQSRSLEAPRFFLLEAAKMLGRNPATGKAAAPSAPQPPTASTPATQPPKPSPVPGSRTTAPSVTITPQAAIQATEAHLANVLAGRGAPQPKQPPKYIML